MPSAISETSVYETEVIGPDDGDTRNAASVRVGMQDLANRTKYLNDNKALSASPTFTGTATFSGQINATGGISLTSVETQGSGGYVGFNTQTLTDSDTTLLADLSPFEYRVPTISANRTYTFPATTLGASTSRKRVRIVRTRTADAFTVTVNRNDGTTIGIISASSAGWIEFNCPPSSNSWVVAAWGGTVTSLHTDV